jgi:hypothetical protein
MPRARVAFWGALAFAAVAGIALRVWILTSPLSTLESDEAVSGLIARHMLEGEFSAMYWLTPYGGTLESAFAALVFAVFGSSVLALKLTTLALFVAAAVLTWRVGIRTVGPRAALVGTALFWISPAFLVWWTTKARAYYGTGVVLGLVVLLLVLRLRERDSRLDAAFLGLALGLGWWTTPGIVTVALPALVWLGVRRATAMRLAPYALPGLVAGMAPWLVWNARNGWLSLDFSPVAGEESTFAERLANLFDHVLPTWLGMRIPFSLDWIAGPLLGWAVVVLAIAAFVVALVRRPAGLEPLLVVTAAFPILYAVSEYTYYSAEPRYVVYVGPVLALLLGRAFAATPAAAAAIAVAVVLSATGLARMEQDGLYQPGVAEGRPAADLDPVIEFLERERERYVLTDYWIAYRLSFESRERVIATSSGFVRYAPHDRLVRQSGWPARVFGARSKVEPGLRSGLRSQGYRRYRIGGWIVYVHSPRAT